MTEGKTCSRCGETKALSDFGKRKVSRDGREGVCRKCRTDAKRKWYSENRDRYRATNKAWADKNRSHMRERSKKWVNDNKDALKAYRAANQEALRKSARQWQIDNPERCVFNVGRRRAAKMQRTPPWLTDAHKQEIWARYQEARRATLLTGVQHHVDHIIPLRGRNISGLHVPWNLQVITAAENMAKSNSC